MTVFRDVINDADIDRIAHLHVMTLPQSLVSRVGAPYARAFYRYVETSPKEVLCLSRGKAGIVNAALVLSLKPANLNKRLALNTPLALWAALRPWRLPIGPAIRDLWQSSDNISIMEDRPELIIIFTDVTCQGQGLGSSLINQCEVALTDHDYDSYTVKTEDTPDNRALSFYSRNGFCVLRKMIRHGTAFVTFEKKIRARSRRE